MAGRRQGKNKPAANRLRNESKPNTLSWTSDDTARADDGETFVDELEDELDEELLDAEFTDDGEPDDEDEVEIARRQVELQAELERQAEEFGLTNLDSAAAFGSNGQAVMEVLDALDSIEIDDAERLADAWLAIDPAERDVVERDLRRRYRQGSHSYELAAAEDAVANWLNGQLKAEPDDAGLWRAVADAARAAVDALVLDEELDDADYDTLYGAWADAMEPEDGDGDEPEETSGETPDAAGPGGAAEDFGPNTELVGELIERVRALTVDEATRLAASWRGQPKSDLRRAHDAVKLLVDEDPAWRAQVKAAQDAVAEPLTTRLVSRPTTRLEIMEKETAARRAALPAAVDAVTALVLADLLDPAHAEMLFGPWADEIGEPDLPEFEDD
jgi:antitoxin component HigA of HigAB toxin-antitoxin module